MTEWFLAKREHEPRRLPQALRIPWTGGAARHPRDGSDAGGFQPGTRVLLADQWVETGGTMDEAIRRAERQKGEVAGIAAVAIDQGLHRGRK